MTCARCGLTTSTTWSRCPSCAAPAGAAPRVPVDCLAKPTPRLPAGAVAAPVGLLGAVTVGLFAAFALLTLAEAAAQIKAGRVIGGAGQASVSTLLDATAVLSFLIGLPAIVAFFVWLVRVVRNAEAFGLVKPRYRGAWVVLNWFIPVLGLWRPKRTLDDAWRGSGGAPTSLIGWWWGLLVVVIYPFPVVVALATGKRVDSPGDYQLLGFADLLTALLWAGSALVVYRLTRLQEPILRQAAPDGGLTAGMGPRPLAFGP